MKKALNVIGEGASVAGRIFSPCSTEINGEINGEIISKESLVIGKEGIVKGNIKTENARIEGKLIGNLIASGEVEISSSGTLDGNLIMKNTDFSVKFGGIFKGNRINVENEEIFDIKKDDVIAGLHVKVKKIS